jgi:carboxylesterase type B
MISPNSLFAVLMLSTLGASVSPTVDLGYAKYRGQALSDGVTQWLGMRYAAPPTGSLRFQPPRDPSHEKDVQDATKVGAHVLEHSIPEQ